MKLFIKCARIFNLSLLFFFISCNNSHTTLVQPKSDTTKVLELAVRTAFYHYNLPDVDRVKRKYHFGDSILFSSESLPLTFLPENIDSFKFKILSIKKIDSLFMLENDLRKLPNYLCISTFEKNDSGYYVAVYSRQDLGIVSGGVLTMDISKIKDSFIVKHMGSGNMD